MNKKIIAVFCVVILMVSVFSACGNKGYLLAKDENGIEHAYVTDENGETVLNDEGNIRIYETDVNGKIAKDENGKAKENFIEMPEILKTDKKYQTEEFIFNIPDGWKIGDNGFIAASTDDSVKIQFNNVTANGSDLDAVVSEAINQSNLIKEEIEKSNGKATLDQGNTKLTSNQIDSYYMIFHAEAEIDGKAQELNTCALYLQFENRIYKAFYQTNSGDEIKIEQVVEIFNNLTLKHTEDKNAE